MVDEAAALEQVLGQMADVAGAAKSGPVQPVGVEGLPVGQMAYCAVGGGASSALRTPLRAFVIPNLRPSDCST
ncbi:hypothetical protein [Mycobacterium lepromatosis]|uniref:hypothetical protein n=1 Tax=Mycobacterium lepromatosis TaxID=480418 RepID=UPI0006795CA7|nr:hypothetical protein [Mycobacterium lepromatosis]